MKIYCRHYITKKSIFEDFTFRDLCIQGEILNADI